MSKYRRNISHEKLVHEFLESLGDNNSLNKTRELAGKVIHDEWHEGHSKGWCDAKAVYGYKLKRLIESRYEMGMSSRNRRILLKAVKEALE